VNCGLRIADCGLKYSRAVFAHSHSRSVTQLLVASLFLCLVASATFAQSIEVTASLSLTDGVAKAEAYVPVQLKVTNHSGAAIEELRISSNSPVETVIPWRLADGESAEKVVPVYFAGSNLQLIVTPRAAGGEELSAITLDRLNVRPLPADTALVAYSVFLSEAGEEYRAFVKKVLNVEHIRFLLLSGEGLSVAVQCGMLDGIVYCESGIDRCRGRAIYFCGLPYDDNNVPSIEGPTFPLGIEQVVEPEAYALFDTKAWPAQDRLQLWIWLAVFALAAGVLAFLAPRHRPLITAVSLIGLAAAACAAIWFSGEICRATAREARMFYVRGNPPGAKAALETTTLLETRGGAVARLPEDRLEGSASSYTLSFPQPILASSEQMFGRLGVLRLEDGSTFETTRPLLVVRRLTSPVDAPFDAHPADITLDALKTLAARSDAVQALLVRGNQGTDASGQTLGLDAWAVQWQASTDPNVAYAGRCLTWWDKVRRQGDGPTLLVWFLAPLPPDAGSSRTRLPALVVFDATR
jgi:hypothetical protein